MPIAYSSSIDVGAMRCDRNAEMDDGLGGRAGRCSRPNKLSRSRRVQLVGVIIAICAASCMGPRGNREAGTLRPEGVALTVSYFNQYTSPPHRVMYAIWPDGTCLWSKNDASGGAPYFLKSIPKETVNRTVELVRSRTSFLWGRRMYTPPHYPFIRIDLWDAHEPIHLWSFHEPIEASGETCIGGNGFALKATEGGMSPNQRTADYRLFRLVWLDVREAVRHAAPSIGDPVTLSDEEWDDLLMPTQTVPVFVPPESAPPLDLESKGGRNLR